MELTSCYSGATLEEIFSREGSANTKKKDAEKDSTSVKLTFQLPTILITGAKKQAEID